MLALKFILCYNTNVVSTNTNNYTFERV